MIVTMKDSVTEIGHGAFQGCTWLTTVTLKEGLLTIEPCAFSNCWDLTNVNIPASVTSIGSLAFENCDDLVAVTVNNPQCEIGDAAHDVFNGCRQVLVLFGHPHSTAETYAAAADIRFGPLYGSCGDNVTFAFDSATGKMTISGTGTMTDFESSYESKYAPWFEYTDNIISVSIDSGVTQIGWNAFRSCVNLSSVNIPSSVISIGFFSFEHCTNLTSITIPASVISIGNEAFFNCNSLASVIINNPNTTIDGYAFANCAASLVIHGWANSTAQRYAQANGISFASLGVLSGACGDNVTFAFDPITGALTISGTGEMANYTNSENVPWYSYRDRIASVVIEDGVTGIGRDAFFFCTSLTNVTIPDSVTYIGSYAFCRCYGLTSADIPNSVSEIEAFAFYYCTNLTSVNIANGVTDIGDDAFAVCTSLTSVVIPYSVTCIKEMVFASCESLISVAIMNPDCTIGDGVHNQVFTNCASSLVLRGWEDSTAQAYAISNNITFQALYDPTFFLPAGLTKINSESFLGISAGGIVIPKNVTEITGNPFAGSSLTTVYGYPESAAETFANTYGYFFFAIDDAWMAAH